MFMKVKATLCLFFRLFFKLFYTYSFAVVLKQCCEGQLVRKMKSTLKLDGLDVKHFYSSKIRVVEALPGVRRFANGNLVT